MRRMILGLLLLVAAVAMVFAAPASDVSVTTDTIVTLTGYSSIEVLTLNGNCRLCFTDGTNWDGVSTGDTLKFRYGRDGFVRSLKWNFAYDRIDTLYIDITTASEVIYTLE